MRRVGLSSCTALLLLLGSSGTSSAWDWGGGFWEKMSGPGYWGYWFGHYNHCLVGSQRLNGKQFCTPTSGKVWLNLGGSFAHTGTENSAEIQSPPVRALSFEPSVDFKIGELFGYAPVLLGGGVGVHRFWGDDVGLTRASVEPRFTLIFWHSGTRHFGFRFAPRIFLQGFTAADFGDPSGSFDSGRADVVRTYAFFYGF